MIAKDPIKNCNGGESFLNISVKHATCDKSNSQANEK